MGRFSPPQCEILTGTAARDTRSPLIEPLREAPLSSAAGTITAPHAGRIRADITSADLIALVVNETVSIVLRLFEPRLKAIVLTGSMARGESTFVSAEDGWNTLGDCEMVLVFESNEPLPCSNQVTEAQEEIELRLEQRGLACLVGMSPVHPR